MRISQSKYLEESLALLVKHFGAEQVQAALSRTAKTTPVKASRNEAVRPGAPLPSLASLLEDVRIRNPSKHAMLEDFWAKLKAISILREAEDMRQFAQLVGLKELSGKSRKDLIRPLMLFLISLSSEDLPNVLASAESISEETRRKGFSVLVDSLLKDRYDPNSR